jgi:pimeloyl-ACP methyl ester carboxylesterase
LASSDTDNNNNNKQQDAAVPKTGWGHKLPSKESAFWKSESTTTATANTASNTNTNTNNSSEPRTGWLHNSASAAKAPATPTTTSRAQQLLQQAMKEQERNHRILSPPTFHACGNGRRVVVTEHKLSLPLTRPNSQPRLDIFFTIVETVVLDSTIAWWKSLTAMTPAQRAQAYVAHAGLTTANGVILYLQGGPGFGAPTPMVDLGLGGDASWAAKALDTYSRIVLMDQRGTGRSTPVTKQTLKAKFPNLFVMDADVENDNDSCRTIPELDASDETHQALVNATQYMAQFRADNIVQDAEDIKDALLLPSTDDPRPYGAVLGQSFGGFCIMTYLSQIEHPPKICLLTGGIAPMLTPTYDVYDSLWERVKERSLQYYTMYPGDIAVVKRIVKRLLKEPVTLPSGGMLTARRFLSLGLSLGGSPSTFASLHAKFAKAFVHDDDDDQDELTTAFLKSMDSAQSFDDAPIYFLLHESIYANGPKESPTSWAAHRAYESRVKTPSDFDYKLTCQMDSNAKPTLFFGETVFPWFADGDFAELSGVGMKSLAEALAQKDDWGPLYDKERMKQALADGSRTAAAAVYYDDMYVDFDACMKVTQRGGPLELCKVWISNEYQHSGLRDNGAQIFTKLHGMATGSVRTPS